MTINRIERHLLAVEGWLLGALFTLWAPWFFFACIAGPTKYIKFYFVMVALCSVSVGMAYRVLKHVLRSLEKDGLKVSNRTTNAVQA